MKTKTKTVCDHCKKKVANPLYEYGDETFDDGDICEGNFCSERCFVNHSMETGVLQPEFVKFDPKFFKA